MPDEILLRLEVAPSAPFGRVIEAEQAFLRLIREVANDISVTIDAVDWIMPTVVANGTISFEVSPTSAAENVREEMLHRVVAAVAGGVVTLEREATRPEYFNDDALEAARHLAVLQETVGSVGVRNGSVGTTLTDRVRQHIDELLGEAYADYGSVEGTVEGLVLHGNRYFTIYEQLTNRAIRCNFGHRIPLGRVTEALERRVTVYGTVRYRPDGEPISVNVEDFDIIPKVEDLPSFSDVYGVLGPEP